MTIKISYEGKYVGVTKWWALNDNRIRSSKSQIDGWEIDGWETMFAENRIQANNKTQERI